MNAPQLAAPHRRMLEQDSGISPEVIAARGYRTVTSAEARQFGFGGQQARDGLLLPIHTTDGQSGLYVLRPDQPRVVEDKRKPKDPLTGDRQQKVIKYEWPRGVGARIDCPPPCFDRLKDARTPLWITEGQKKGDALASWGLCTIDLPSGVWGWKSKQDGILADLDFVVWAEAVALYKAGEPCLPTAEETRLQNAINDGYMIQTPFPRRSKPKDQALTQLWFELSKPGNNVASGR